MFRTYHLFISHSWTHGTDYRRLCRLLNSQYGFFYKNYFVRKTDPVHAAPDAPALYQVIKQQMALCDVVLIQADKYVPFGAWIQQEIAVAETEFTPRKPILAIVPNGYVYVPNAIRDHADLLARFILDSIVACIGRLAT